MKRRSFIKGLAGILAGPAIAKAEWLMPIKPLIDIDFISQDWTIDAAGNIKYIGAGHDSPNATYTTPLQLHRWLSDLTDREEMSFRPLLDITDHTKSERHTDQIIRLVGARIDDHASEHLYDGSIHQVNNAGDPEKYVGIVNFSCDAPKEIRMFEQDLEINPFWNIDGGINSDPEKSISHRFMIKDNQKTIRAISEFTEELPLWEHQKATFTKEFHMNHLFEGNNVMPL